MAFDYNGLIRKPAQYIAGAFEPDLVSIEDIENYLNERKYIKKELELIHPDTGQKLPYETHDGPWRGTYDADVIENLWNIGASFILQTPYINFKERFHGAGDQSTALYAHYISKKSTTREILENVANDIYGILLEKKTYTKIEKKKFRAKNLNNL